LFAFYIATLASAVLAGTLGPPGDHDFKNNQRSGGDAGCRYHYCTTVVIVIVVALAVVVFS